MKEDHSSAAKVTVANLLDAIVRLSEFDVSVRVERATALIDGGPASQSSVETKSLGRLSARQLREAYESNGWRTGEWGEGLDIRPKPKGEAARFRLELAELLNAYAVRIDDCPGPDQHCIGHVLGDVMGAWSSTGRVAQDGRLDVILPLSGDGWRFQRLRVRFQSRLSGLSQMSFLGSAHFIWVS